MKRLLLAVFLLPLAASAQLQLFLAPQGGEETPFSGVYDMGSVAVSETSSVRFRLRNLGRTSVTMTYLYAKGTGFTMTGEPTMPFVVASGMNLDFTIRFSPPNLGNYSANMQINGTGYILRGAGLASATLRLEGQDLAPGASIDCGRVERGASGRAALVLVNTTPEPVNVESLQIGGAGFSLAPGAPAFPLAMGPATSVAFEVVYAPLSSGIATGTLTLDRRVFRLTGTSFEPALPRPTVIIESPAIRSGQQGKVSVRLAAVSKAFAKGELRMELRPAGTIRDNDSAAMFIAGSRSITFDVAPGDDVVKLRGDTSAVFQSGTTAGTLVFVVEAGGFKEQSVVTVAPETVRLDKTIAIRSGSSIEVTLGGYDNTHSVSALAFTFYSGGQPMAGMPVRSAVSSEFERWWTDSTLGGIFQLKAAFPITGDASKITGVDVAVTSSAGTATTERLAF